MKEPFESLHAPLILSRDSKKITVFLKKCQMKNKKEYEPKQSQQKM